MFMLGIISALQRRGWELEASQQELAATKDDAQAKKIALEDKLKGARGLAEELDLENRNYKAKLIEMCTEIEQLRRQAVASPTLPVQVCGLPRLEPRVLILRMRLHPWPPIPQPHPFNVCNG